jgi:hypothetical protein
VVYRDKRTNRKDATFAGPIDLHQTGGSRILYVDQHGTDIAPDAVSGLGVHDFDYTPTVHFQSLLLGTESLC